MAIIGAEETITKISSLVESQFPEFMREDGPRFVNFLKAYYEFMEQASTDNGPMPIHGARSLPDYADIDRTLDQFVEEFRKQFMTSIPRNVQADKRLLSKYILDFYRTRGSQYSYETLFRALFDEDILFYYPGEDILRASDGRWIKTTTVIVGAPFAGNPDDFGGREITSSSGGTATVLEVYRLQIKGTVAYVLTLDNVKGTFKDADTVTDSEGTSAEITSTSGALVEIDIVDGGGFHNVGDVINITGATSGASGIGVIRATTTDTALTARIVDGGSGYEVGANNTFTVTSDSGTGLSISVTGIANTATANLSVQTIEPAASIQLNQGPNFQAGPNTATLQSQFATANVANTLIQALKFENFTFGAISNIRIDDVGNGYTTLPPITVRNQRIFDQNEASKSYSGAIRGDDAIIVVQTDSDTITLDRDGKSVTTTHAAHYDGSGEAVVSGVINNPGSYFDTKGFISWDKKLQDNFYYQEYSYVIKATSRLKQYRDIVQKVLHPAGTKLFGQVEIVITANLNPSAIFTIPLVHPVSVNEAANANGVVTPAVVFGTIAQSEVANANGVPNATVAFAPEIIERANANGVPNATTVAVGALNEAANANGVPDATVAFAPAVNEAANANGVPNATVAFAPAVNEAANANGVPDAAVIFNRSIPTESVNANGVPIAEHFIRDEYFVKVVFANNVISTQQSTQVTSFQNAPVGAFDGNPRLVQAISPDAGTTASFNGGTLKANTGALRVGGFGTNVIFIPVSTGTPSAVFTVNSIFSNTAFTLRTNFLPLTANARFSYSTAS